MKNNDFERRLAAAFQELDSKGIRIETVYPPMYRLASKVGVLLPPPLYRRFWGNLLFSGGFFGVCYCLLTWFLFGGILQKTMSYALFEFAFAAISFGGIMASYYAFRRARLKLTEWEQLVPLP